MKIRSTSLTVPNPRVPTASRNFMTVSSGIDYHRSSVADMQRSASWLLTRVTSAPSDFIHYWYDDIRL